MDEAPEKPEEPDVDTQDVAEPRGIVERLDDYVLGPRQRRVLSWPPAGPHSRGAILFAIITLALLAYIVVLLRDNRSDQREMLYQVVRIKHEVLTQKEGE